MNPAKVINDAMSSDELYCTHLAGAKHADDLAERISDPVSNAIGDRRIVGVDILGGRLIIEEAYMRYHQGEGWNV